MPKVLLIIAHADYQDIEYGKTRQELEKVGIEIEVASSQLGEAKGKLGGRAPVDLSLVSVDVKKYDGVVFIGGPGARREYTENKLAHKIARDVVALDKILAAICIAPTILARAGILSGKRATVWAREGDIEGILILKEGGATYDDRDVTQDGKIITACGPEAAEEFGKKIAENLV